ncbi:MAG: hypothetical protein NZM04_06860 [Methylacidiphilales bacterium]|nr:hypothetical protein [Candidatus Methylacidiphilales bacterium]MDW8349312.1 hypothetical protein [Verrucomicrobiae bacterium]
MRNNLYLRHPSNFNLIPARRRVPIRAPSRYGLIYCPSENKKQPE